MKQYKYFTISGDDSSIPLARELLDLLQAGFKIISAVGAIDGVHYILMKGGK